MTSNLAPAAGRAVPGGALVAFGIGLLLYLSTSLVLGSPASRSRVFDVSLNLPDLEPAPAAHATLLSDPLVGSRLMPAAQQARFVLTAPLISVTPVATVPPASAGDGFEAPAVPVRADAVHPKATHYHDADERSHRLARRR